jgi:hypothetical protein
MPLRRILLPKNKNAGTFRGGSGVGLARSLGTCTVIFRFAAEERQREMAQITHIGISGLEG